MFTTLVHNLHSHLTISVDKKDVCTCAWLKPKLNNRRQENTQTDSSSTIDENQYSQGML